MRELGERGAELHRDLAPALAAAKVDLAFLVGPLMLGLYELLPAPMRGGHRAKSEEMVEPLLRAIRPGDTVLIKGSLGTRMAPLVEAVRALDAAAPKKAANGH
jgi:UDP-N-acetylmuramoyl-tripeptide--D-alanyl-D-alanine ligase